MGKKSIIRRSNVPNFHSKKSKPPKLGGVGGYSSVLLTSIVFFGIVWSLSQRRKIRTLTPEINMTNQVNPLLAWIFNILAVVALILFFCSLTGCSKSSPEEMQKISNGINMIENAYFLDIFEEENDDSGISAKYWIFVSPLGGNEYMPIREGCIIETIEVLVKKDGQIVKSSQEREVRELARRIDRSIPAGTKEGDYMLHLFGMRYTSPSD